MKTQSIWNKSSQGKEFHDIGGHIFYWLLNYPFYSQDILDEAEILARVEKKTESGKTTRDEPDDHVLAHDRETDAGHALDPENAGGIGHIQENFYVHKSQFSLVFHNKGGTHIRLDVSFILLVPFQI